MTRPIYRFGMCALLAAVLLLIAATSAPMADAMFSARRSGTLAVPSDGLFGTVLRGPIPPVCNAFKPCEVPAPHVTLVFACAGRVATTTTDFRGIYMIFLPPGVCMVTTAQKSRLGDLWPRWVHIRAGRVDGLNFHIDTGIQ